MGDERAGTRRAALGVDIRFAAVYSLRANKIVLVREFETRAAALRAVGLAGSGRGVRRPRHGRHGGSRKCHVAVLGFVSSSRGHSALRPGPESCPELAA